MVGRIWLAAGMVGAALVLVPAAHAAPPQCPSAKLSGPPNTSISLASLSCTNVGMNFQIIVDPWPEHGDFTGPPYAFVPDKDFHGTDQFKYTVTDNDTHETSAPATVDLLVDTAPTCDDGTASTAFNQAVKVQPACRDADGDAVTIVADSAGHGTVGTDFTYTPAAGYSGPDTIVFHARDAFGLVSSGHTIQVSVAPPVIVPASTPPPDTTAPNALLKTTGKPSLAKGVTLTLTSNEAGTATLTLTVDKTTAKKLKLASTTVGTGTATLVNGATNATVKFSAKARKALKRARQVKLLLTVVVRDAAGNTATKTLSVTIKNPQSRATTRG